MPDTITSILDTKGNQVYSIRPEASVYDAIAMMADKRIGSLLVMDGDRLEGIVSERDYARKVILQGHSSKDTPVTDIMTRDVVTVTPNHTIEDCMRIVTERRIRHLPVICGDRVTGMVSIGDLVRAIISDQAHTIDQLHTYICGAAVVK